MENRIFLERYRLSLGRNGLPVELHRSPTARTFRAQEIESGREVALTLVAAPPPNDVALLERCKAEAEAALEINQINIPRLFDFGRDKDELIYVTEYCEGHTAAAWVAARGPLLIGAILRLALQVVEAMNATAFQRLHHPALNPDNILLVTGETTEGDWPPVKVLHWFAPAPDFSQMDDERIDNAARFAAPEQLSEGRVDVRVEIYSLGATMWFLLTGAPPASVAAGWTPAPSAGSNLRGAPKIVRHLLSRMLSVNPDERPQDPVALASYLQTCLARVDRQGKMEKRLRFPLLARGSFVEAKARPPIPIRPLAWAAGCLMLVALAVVFLPWPVTSHNSASSAQQTLPKDSPNDVRRRRSSPTGSGPSVTSAIVTTGGQARGDENPENEFAATATSAAARVEPPIPEERSVEIPTASRPVLASSAPPTAEVASNDTSPIDTSARAEGEAEALAPSPAVFAADTAPSEKPVSSPSAAKPNEPPTGKDVAEIESTPAAPIEPIAPGEGPVGSPAASSPAVAASTPRNDESVSSSVGSGNDEPEPQSAPPMPPASDRSAGQDKAVADREIESASKPVPTKRAAIKRKVAASSDFRETRRVAHSVRRARPLPNLRVGSSPAELVGTTSDGRWILSVSGSSRRIIVPPPPDFGR